MNLAEDIDIVPSDAIRSLWLAGVLTWKLHECQLIIDNAIEGLPVAVKEAVILCCRRFGKSYYGCYRGVVKSRNSKTPRLTRIIGPDIKQTEMIVDYNMARLTKELDALGLRGLVNRVKSEKKYEIGDSAIFLGGFDSQEDSLRGGEADEILIEESGMADPDQYNYQMTEVLKPQLLKTRGRMIHLTTLPKIPGHPFIKETIPKAKLNNAFYSYTIYDDPLATPEIIEDAISDCGGEHTDAFKREYLNEIIRDRSIVIVPDFKREIHVREFPMPVSINYEIFTDWGGTRDKTVSLLMGYDFLSAKDLVIDEMHWPHNTSTELITREIKERWFEKYDIKTHCVDAHGQTRVDIEQTHRMSITTPTKDDWESNINHLAVRFTQKKVVIHPRCELLVETCDSGTFNKNRTDFDRSEALGHMDAIAALMYGNRHLDRSSPFKENSYIPDTHWAPPPKEVTPIIPFKSFMPGGNRKVFK